MDSWMQHSLKEKGSLHTLAHVRDRQPIPITERLCSSIGFRAVKGVEPDQRSAIHKSLMGKFNGWEAMLRFNKNIPVPDHEARIARVDQCKTWASRAFYHFKK
jgi:hypothetical protein